MADYPIFGNEFISIAETGDTIEIIINKKLRLKPTPPKSSAELAIIIAEAVSNGHIFPRDRDVFKEYRAAVAREKGGA